MPTKAESRKVLDGRGEVLSYTRNPNVFYLRVYVPEKEGYTSQKIEDAKDIETACRQAIDVYLSLQSSPKPKPEPKPKEATVGGTGSVSASVARVRIDDQVKLFLEKQQERVDNNLIKEGTLRNLRKALINWLLPYCEKQGLVYTRDIQLGSLDDFIIFCGNASKNTIRTHLTNIKTFLKALSRQRLLDPYVAGVISDLTPKVKITEEDLSANPPFRNEAEWLEFVKVLHAWVREAERLDNPRILYYRRKFWSLIMCLKQSGARPSEMLNLRWKDIETQDVGRISKSQRQLDEQALHEQGIDPSTLPVEVQESLGRVPRYITHLRIITTKTGVPREVTCNSAEVLARWKKFQMERLEYLRQKHSYFNLQLTPDTKVFESPVNGEWKQQGYSVFTQTWKELIKRAEPNLKGPLLSEHKYSIYSLRATRAQQLLELGVDVAIAAKSLGHSANMMLRVYAKLPVREQAMKAAIAGIEFGKRKSDLRTVELEDLL